MNCVNCVFTCLFSAWISFHFDADLDWNCGDFYGIEFIKFFGIVFDAGIYED